MQIPGLAVQAQSLEVEEAVGDVAALLHFVNEQSWADGVYAAGGHHEEGAGLHLLVDQQVQQVAIHQSFDQLVRLAGSMPQDEFSAGFSGEHVPAFGLSALLPLQPLSLFVVRVHLDA